MRRLLLAVLLVLCGACTGDDPAPQQSLPPIALDSCPAAPRGPAPTGDKLLPDLTLACLGEGPAVRLRGLADRPYLINVWASWCLPCAREMPALQRVYVAERSRVGMLGIDTHDTPRDARQTIQSTEVSYPSVVDPDEKFRKGLLAAGFQAVGTPLTVFVQSGRILAVLIGEHTEAELRAAIGEHFGYEL